MIKTLCLDFGNTRRKAAIFEGDEFKTEFVFPGKDCEDYLRSLLDAEKPDHAILSSVINHEPGIESVLQERTTYHKLGAESKLNFTLAVGKPETVGADRLALAAAAVKFYPGKNNLIIALGTCITYNFVNAENRFIGGSISPGTDMRFRAMHDYTALLPEAKISENFPLIGYDTNTNLQSGVLHGISAEIDGITALYANKFGNFNVVLTGGNSALFAARLKSRIFADPNFLFKGLYAISQTNNLRD